MHSSINLFLFFFLPILFFGPKSMRALLSSSSETKLFVNHSFPYSYLTFLGDSHIQHSMIALTKEVNPINARRSSGVVLYNHPMLILDPRSRKVPSFYTTFSFSIENTFGGGEGFGDGLAFLISPSRDLLGSPGYLGLVDSTDLTRNKFMAIEFDTKRDSVFHDPDDNHVGLDINNLFSMKLATASSAGVDLKSGDLINTWIDYNSNEKRLEVFLSYSILKPRKPLLKVDIDLSNYLDQNMYVGFSASTEGSTQLTHIDQWEFTVAEYSPPPPSPPGINFPNASESEHRHGHISRFTIGLIVGLCSVPFIVLFGWFCWKNLMEMIKKSEGTKNLQMEGITSQEILLFILVDEVARGLNVEKVLDNEAELIRMKTVQSSVPLCNSFPAVKPSIQPLCDGLPLRANGITSS